MNSYVNEKKLLLNQYLASELKEYRQTFSGHNRWADDSFEKITEFVSRGKMIRGALAHLGFEAYKGNNYDLINPVSGALELLHAGFLIHDDVMDNDEIRRGKPSIHVQYRDLLTVQNSVNIVKNSENIALCLGNICYFLAFDLLGRAKISPKKKNDLKTLFNREAVMTGLGQMEDLYISGIKELPDLNTILNIYRMKTARYTFSLPLAAGSITGSASVNEAEKLINTGIEIGTLFQMRDDELNMFGNTAKTGKSSGSDIREGKKTIIYSLILENTTGRDHEFASGLLGNSNISEKDISELIKIAESSGAHEKHRIMAFQFAQNALNIIKTLKTEERFKSIFETILNFSYKREN